MAALSANVPFSPIQRNDYSHCYIAHCTLHPATLDNSSGQAESTTTGPRQYGVG